MKIRKRVLSCIVATCMLITAFSFAPGVYAETESQGGGDPPVVKSEAPVDEGAESLPAEDVPETCKITVQDPAGGTITVKPSEGEVRKGTVVTYTVTPDKGNKTTAIQIGGKAANVTAPYGTTTGTFTAEADTTITAVFSKLTKYKITTSVNSTSRGSITKSATVEENGSITIKSTPKSGYFLSDLQVNGKSVGAKATYTINNAKANYTVKAVFSKRVKIMLDAGHYGKYNRSPVYSSYYESNMTWALHNYLKAELQEYPGFYVGVTRSSQSKDMDVYYRGKAAAGYDLFLSLHSNSSTSKTSDYPLIITQKGNTGDKLAKNLGKSIEDTMNTKQGYKIWQKLSSSGAEYYGVLRGSKSAGVKGMIVEHSFHTNLAATKWLSSNTNLKKMAKEEADVLAEYYGVTKDGSAGNSNNNSNNSDNNSNSNSSGNEGSSGNTTTSKTVSTSDKVKVTVSNLNMRKSYSTSSKSMGKAKKGTTYQLKAKTKDGKWGQLKTNGYWIYLKGYTTPVKNSSSSGGSSSSSKTVVSSQKVKITVSSLNTRKSYSTSSKKMGTVKKNKIYQLKAKTRDGKWGQLKTNSYWIYLKGYTKTVSSSTSTSSSKVVKSSQKVKVTVSSLNMRKSYSTGSKSMGKVRKNKTYQLKAKTRDGKWGQLKTNSYWIYLKGYTKAVK